MTENLQSPVDCVATPERLHREGYALLRGAIPAQWLSELRVAFDNGVKDNDQWPVPRGAGWRHALMDLSPMVQSVCRLPELLAAVGVLIGERYFLSQVEGREPLAGGGHQGLHRDLSAQRCGDTVLAIAYLDDYGPDNGATRILPGSHRPTQLEHSPKVNDVCESFQVSGCAGDILVFDADLLHAGSVNRSGARRRSLLSSYFAEPLYASHLDTRQLRSIRMETSWFDPPSM